MKRYILDTNHLSALLKPTSPLRDRVQATLRSGDRVGTCVPVLCEWEAGIQALAKPDRYRRALQQLLRMVRVWPLEVSMAQLYGLVYQELRRSGRILSQVDMMLVAIARHLDLIVLTTDKDFTGLPALRIEDWLT